MSSVENHILKRLEGGGSVRPSVLFSELDPYDEDSFSEKQVWLAIQRMTARGDIELGVDNRLPRTDEEVEGEVE